jgi:predicted nucleic acid-binding protein
VEEHLRHFGLSAVDQVHIDLAVRMIKRHRLTAGDALHLASAIALSKAVGRRTMRFATADGDQAQAARDEGLKVLDLT